MERGDLRTYKRTIPFYSAPNGRWKIPEGLPAELVKGPVPGKVEAAGLVGCGCIGFVYPAAWPVHHDLLDQCADGLVGRERGAEVVGSASLLQRRAVAGLQRLVLVRGELQVTGEGLQHMLPGARGGGVAHRDGLAVLQVADAVWDDAVFCPVAAADDVAGAGGGDADSRRLARVRRVEIGAAIGGDGQLGGGLAGAIGVVAAEGVILAVGAEPFAVFVALVGGDTDRGADAVAGLVARRELAQGVEQMNGAHDVGGVGLDRLAVGQSDQGLCGQMKDIVRLGSEDALRQSLAVADVQDVMFKALGETELVEQRGLGVARQGDADDTGAEHEQPFAEPRAFEAGVAGDEDGLAAVGLGQLLVQRRHGSVPGVDEDLLGS